MSAAFNGGSRFVTAHKWHTCSHCRADIPRGSRYLSFDDGTKRRRRVCQFCAVNATTGESSELWRAPLTLLASWQPERARFDCAAVREYVDELRARGPGAGP